MGSSRHVFLLIGLISLSAFAGCQGTSDKERIRDSNEAAREGQTFNPDELSGTISVFDLRDGDCFNAPTVPEFGIVDFEDVELVLCSGDWRYRVLNSFAVDREGSYPGDEYFTEEADFRCHRLYGVFLFPLAESWALGDRTVSCLQEQ